MISEHGQTGSAVAVDVEGVGGHDGGPCPRPGQHQDADSSVAQAQGIVHHSVKGVKGQPRKGSGVRLRVGCASGLTWALAGGQGGRGTPG